MPTTLVLNTSTPRGGIALFGDDTLLLSQEWGDARRTGRNLHTVLEQILSLTETNPDIIDQVVFLNGPGSFTGLRVGLAALKGFFYGLSPAYAPVSTLETLAQQIPVPEADILSMVAYRKRMVIAGRFRKMDSVIQPLDTPFLLKPEDLSDVSEDTWLVGATGEVLTTAQQITGNAGFNLLPNHLNQPDLTAALMLGRRYLRPGNGSILADAEPAYHAEFILHGGRE